MSSYGIADGGGSPIGTFAPLDSPAFIGTPTAPTPATGDNSTELATTAFVKAQGYAPLASPAFTGTPTAPTQTALGGGADSSTKLATTAFVNAFVGGQGYAPLASPTFTGTPTAPTPTASDNSTKLATTAFVQGQGYAPLASPTFTGTPTAPTPTGADNSTKLATTAWVRGYTGGGSSNAFLAAAAALASGAGGTLTPNIANGQAFGFEITANGNLTINAPTNPPSNAQTTYLAIYVLNDPGNTTSTITWNAAYSFSTIAKPTSLVQGSSFFILFVWNPYKAANQWQAVAKF